MAKFLDQDGLSHLLSKLDGRYATIDSVDSSLQTINSSINTITTNINSLQNFCDYKSQSYTQYGIGGATPENNINTEKSNFSIRELKLSGEAADVETAAHTLEALVSMAARGEAVSTQTVQYVIGLAHRFDVDVRIGIYGTMDFFDTTAGLLDAGMADYLGQIPESIHSTKENYDFVALYHEWRNGFLRLRCQSIFSELVIHSNGDVPLCQNLDLVLGNIHQQSLDEIFNSRPSCELQRRYSRECNGCWVNFHRKYDIILLRELEKLFPKSWIEWFYGKYQWSVDATETYRQHFNRMEK